jgi:Xaa-Pro aminopeptidase
MNVAARIDRAQRLLGTRGLDALLLSVGPDLPYFTGYRAPQLERLTMAVIPSDGRALLVVPRLEAMKVVDVGAFDIRPWDETDDPVAIVTDRLDAPSMVAIGDHTWARFVLALQHQLPTTTFTPASLVTSEIRITKDDGEIELLASAAAAADRVAARLAHERFSGRPERQVAGLVREMCVEEGHDEAWDPIIASGPNAASPHHAAGDRVISAGDTVVVDFGGTVGGYYADTTRTFCVGEPDGEVAAAYAVLERAHQAAVDVVAPGVAAEVVDRAARAVIADAGYGDLFIHRTGHGIGLDVHEDPYIVEGNSRLLEPGMAFSIEPGIYSAGRWGMRIEDIVTVTDSGVRNLNRSSRRLAVVA